MNRWRTRGSICLLWCLTYLPASGQTGDSLQAIPVLLSEGIRPSGIGVEELQLFSDPTDKYSWQDLLLKPWDQQLLLSPQKGTVWLRLVLSNTSSEVHEVMIDVGWHPRLDVYQIRKGTLLRHEQLGTEQGYPAGKALGERNRFRLALTAHGQDTLLLAMAPWLQNNFSTGLYLLSVEEAVRESTETYFDRRYLVNQYFGFLTIFGFQALLFLILWLATRHPAFAFYSLYLLMMVLFLYSKYGNYLFMPWPAWWDNESKLINASASILSVFLYFKFIVSFLDLSVKDPGLRRWILWAERWTLFFLLAVPCFYVWLGPQIPFFSILTFPLIVGALPMIWRLWKQGALQARLIGVGSLSLTMGAAIANLGGLLGIHVGKSLSFWDFYLLGTVGEVVCFSVALAFKLRQDDREKWLAQQALILRLEENQALNEELQGVRNQLARDLHDDIGATLSSIAFYSELAEKDPDYRGSSRWLQKISAEARYMVDVMGDTVWNLHPKNDLAFSLFNKLRDKAHLLAAKGIVYQAYFEPSIEELPLPMPIRKNLFLIGKEAINNILKHAQATEASLRIAVEAGHLIMIIHDNGQGMKVGEKTQGNGLINMKVRAEELGGTFDLRTDGSGTQVKVIVPLPTFGEAANKLSL